MKLLSLLLLFFSVFETLSANQLNADKRIFCFTFIYFQSGSLFKQYLSAKHELQKQLVDQVEMCEELIEDIKTDEGLKGVYDDQEKLVEIIQGLRKVKQELGISSGKGGVSLSERQQQIVRDFKGYSVMFEEIQGKKGSKEEEEQRQDGGENAEEIQL